MVSFNRFRVEKSTCVHVLQTVYPHSIHRASLGPHCLMLQPYSKMIKSFFHLKILHIMTSEKMLVVASGTPQPAGRYIWYQFQNPTSPCSQVIAFTSLSGKLDL